MESDVSTLIASDDKYDTAADDDDEAAQGQDSFGVTIITASNGRDTRLEVPIEVPEGAVVSWVAEGGLKLGGVRSKVEAMTVAAGREEQGLVVLAVGGADVKPGVSPADLAVKYDAMLKEVCDLYPAARIAITGVLPRRQHLESQENVAIIKLNNAIQLMSAAVPMMSFINTFEKFVYQNSVVPDYYKVETCEDDAHLSTLGKVVLGEIWRDAISQSLNNGL